MQKSSQPWYRWFWTAGDHWYVIFWTLVGGILAGPVSAGVLTAKAERRGERTSRYWQVFGGTLAAQAALFVVAIVALGVTIWAAPTPQVLATGAAPLSDSTQSAEGFTPNGTPETTSNAAGPANPPSDLVTLLQDGNAVVSQADIFYPMTLDETASCPSCGPVTDPDEAALLYQLYEANETAQQLGNPEAWWAVIDPRSGFYQHYDTAAGVYVGFDNDEPFGVGSLPDTTPGKPRTWQVTITQVTNPDGTAAGPGGNGIAKNWRLTFAPEGPAGQWMITKMVPAPAS
jgi:hypothetical protein